MTNGDRMDRDATGAIVCVPFAFLCAAVFLGTGELGWAIAELVVLLLSIYFGIDYWRINRYIDRSVREEMRRADQRRQSEVSKPRRPE